MTDELMHYGTPRHSGRYPWGSGQEPFQNSMSFLSSVSDLSKKGLSEVEIAKGFGMTTSELRAKKAIAKNEKRAADISEAQGLKDRGWGNVAIGERMGINESSVRALLKPGLKDRNDILISTRDSLKRQMADGRPIDIGTGVENHLGVSRTRLNTAIAMLKEEGYDVKYLKVEQLGTGHETNVKVLTPPGMSYGDLYKAKDSIRQVDQTSEYSNDGGRTFLGIHEPKNLSSNRVSIRYGTEGGADMDGVLEVRPGVKDVSLGGSRYAQVRVAVDGTHFIKGMALYSDDLPDGVDVRFNTNKSPTGNKLDALKSMKDDPDNPFGSTIRRQITETDSKGNVKVTSSMNLVNEEGSWNEWSRTLSSQVLSKQSPALAKQQLSISLERKQQELAEINSLTNPQIKQKLLMSFADDCDSSAVHLKAAALPRQRTQVILPITSMKEGEVYAPNFRDGERVALVRYPHGGKFEIPELTVNNRQPVAKKVLGQAQDAIGINPKVAQRLSGADFDGDSVLVIPNTRGHIQSSPPLEGLKNFDPQSRYPKYDGMKVITPTGKQHAMGDVSNLITDMTIKGATDSEIARAVRHSMVVIDAEKHELNYKQSAIDNDIAGLKKKYQGSSSSGASTLISKASSEVYVDQRTPRSASEGGPIDRETGRKVYTPTGETYVNRKGQTVTKKTASTRMAEAEDARALSSGTVMESIYADHANKLKAMGNEARKTALRTEPVPYSKSARETYSKEVASLKAALNVAQKNAPLERQAQLIANTLVSEKLRSNPDRDSAEIKKIKGQALQEARSRTGAEKQRIQISEREWEAIQAGAITKTFLNNILNNTDLSRIKELATPRQETTMSSSILSRVKSMAASGYTQAEIADALGVSTSSINNALNS